MNAYKRRRSKPARWSMTPPWILPPPPQRFTISRTSERSECDKSRHLQTGKISFELYAKPMSIYDYIPPASSHPPHTFKGVVKGEGIRALKNASRKELFEGNIVKLKGWFGKRGYPPRIINGVLDSITYEQRHQFTQLKPLKDNTWVPEAIPPERAQKTVLTLPYSKSITGVATQEIKTTIQEQDWPESVQTAMGGLTIAWKRGESIRDALSKPKFKPSQHATQLYTALTSQRPPTDFYSNLTKQAKMQQAPIMRAFK